MKCATCNNEVASPEMMTKATQLDEHQNLVETQICPMCAEYYNDVMAENQRERVTVTRSMAMDAGCPEMEGMEIDW